MKQKRGKLSKISNVPESLQIWFLVHFIVDIIFAIPLMIAPIWFFKFIGFTIINNFILISLLSRIVGAALLGIGLSSYLVHKKGIENFSDLLTQKIIWSIAAIVALIWSLTSGAPVAIFILLLVFVVFSLAWIYYKCTYKFKKIK